MWFEMQNTIVDFFLNFDNDRIVQQWQIFSNVCSLLTTTVENCQSSTTVENAQENRKLLLVALQACITILKTLMDMSATAHLIPLDGRVWKLTRDGHWTNDEEEDAVEHEENENESDENEGKENNTSNNGQLSTDSVVARLRANHIRRRHSSIRNRYVLQQRNKKTFEEGMKLAKEKSLKKAIQFLIATNYLSETPQDVASFLRKNSHDLDEAEVSNG